MKKNSGFTLIEILVVLSIISTLFIVIVPQVNGSFNKTHETGIRTDFRSFQLATESHMRDTSGKNIQVDSLNSNFDSSHQIIEVDGKLQTKKKDPYQNNYGVLLDERKAEFHSFGAEGEDNKKAYTLLIYYYNGFIDSCTTGFSTKNIELKNLREKIEGFECGDTLPAAPIPSPEPIPEIPPIPSVPNNFRVVSSTPQSLNLAWNTSNHATSYILKRDGVIVYSGSNNNFSDTGLTVYTTYNYSVIAKNDRGDSLSISITARTMPTEETVKLPDIGTGSCSPYNPYIIKSIGELQGIKLDLDACFELGNNINGTVTSNWNGGRGFDPIHNNDLYFEGQLNGKGYTIDNLFINRPTEDWVGLFDAIQSGGSVQNISITNGNITGNHNIALLSAYVDTGASVSDVTVNGSVIGNSSVGGAVGLNGGELRSMTSSAQVIGVYKVGAVVGDNSGYMNGSTTTSQATVQGDWSIGGSVGYNEQSSVLLNATVENMNVIGNNSGGEAGGVVGQNIGDIENAISRATIIGDATTGGIVGLNVEESSLKNSNFEGSVEGYLSTGGAIGENIGNVENIVIGQASTITGEHSTGGAIGYNSGTIKNVTSNAKVIGYIDLGGIIGTNEGYVETVLLKSVASVSGLWGVGGAIGYNAVGSHLKDATVEQASISGLLNRQAYEWDGGEMGGVIGINSGRAETIKSNAKVLGLYESIGGVIGENRENGILYNAFYEGDVEGIIFVGGIVGENLGKIQLATSKGTVKGENQVGGISGNHAVGQYISDVTVENMTVTGFEDVGGVIGESYGHLINAQALVTVEGDYVAGGIVGDNYGAIDNATLKSNSIVTGDIDVGGIAGWHGPDMTISNVNTEQSSIIGNIWVGGVVGSNKGGLSDAHSEATVNGNTFVGGVLGENYGTLSNATSLAQVKGEDGVGGVVGENYGTMSNSILSSGATVTGDHQVGGIAGFNDSNQTIANVTTETAAITGVTSVGGSIGENKGYLTGASSKATVFGETDVGGIVGENYGDISNVISEAIVEGVYCVGGIAGDSFGNIHGALVKANARVTGYDEVGGISSYIAEGKTISNVTVEGAIITGTTFVGGVIGESDGTLTNATSRAKVSGYEGVGGLIGVANVANIKNSYAAGSVTGTTAVGGLVGRSTANIVSSYYDQTTTGQSDTGKGTRKTTTQMKTQSTYVGWDFVNTWNISPAVNNGYPYLR